MDVTSVALQGLEQASAQLDAVATRVAAAASASDGAAAVDIVSLSEEMVALMSAKTAFAANVAVLKTAEQTQQSVLNVMA